MTQEVVSTEIHPFVQTPHKTLFRLAVPVLLSLVAEPLTGLVDTAFVAALGATALAGLGVGTVALSSIFWIFNFLGIGSQTEVAQALGRQNRVRAAQLSGLAMNLAAGIGLVLIIGGWFLIEPVAAALGASGSIQRDAVSYMQIRLFGAPAVLLMLAAFGILRGAQDMRTPLWVTLAVNTLNIMLDGPFIFGLGPLPALGIAGAAWASVLAQWLGTVWVVWLVIKRLGVPGRIKMGDAANLMHVGFDLFVRTGVLTLFLLIAARSATLMGPDGGAAHQAIRQVWVFTTLFLDAFAITGQSLVGYFLGANWPAQVRRVAQVVCGWSLATGGMLALAMLVGQQAVVSLLVPASAVALFGPAWWISALTLPVNALAFATDGLLWGAGDFAYLRNAMALATAAGLGGLMFIDPATPNALIWIWLVTAGWITLRAATGVLRVWPGIGNSPFNPTATSPSVAVPLGPD